MNATEILSQADRRNRRQPMPYLDYLLFRPPTKDKEDSDYLALVRGENDDAVPVSASGSGATGMLAIEDAITNFNAKVKK